MEGKTPQLDAEFRAAMAKRVQELTKERDTYTRQANAEINHQIGVYNGRIAEIERLLEPPKAEEPKAQ